MSKRLHNNEGIYNSNYIQSLERKYCCSSAVLASSGCVVSSGGLGGRVALRIYEGGRRLMYTAAVGAMLLNNMAPAAMADTTVVSAGDISAGLGAGEGSDILVYGTTSNTALSGGRETVYSGGLTVSTVVSPGEQIVSSGGVANYTTVNDFGVQYIYSGGEAMVVSQFTLLASTKKGNRPSYIRAAGHEVAVPMYEAFCRRFSEEIGQQVATGVFGADMQVELVNDGPVTIWMDTKNKE